ncbi:hypothetical protein BDW62DRAFT_199430 [Aspergillus aurantiobrunneus]
MQPIKSPEPELATTMAPSRSRSRSASISSDSQLSLIHLAPPSVNPPPSFIAASSASQIITSDQEFNAADFVADDEDDSGALVTAEALSTLNGFLDHLLLNILAAAKSTQLASIRPAVADVLKPRLAKMVVSVADEELSDYLGEAEDEQIEFRGGQTPNGEFDLIHTWKLTRLRCMVYTRLGDMEEDDEEEYIAQEGLVDDEGAPRRFTNHIGNITPAAAIFLTSIIEHIGEQALIIAGETARSRLSPKIVVECDEENGEFSKERGSMNRLIVEELDVEKLALNPTLGRLWRTWRKRTRTPNLSRLASRDSLRRRGTLGLHSRKSSFSVADDAQSQLSPPIEETQPDTQTEVDPVSVPLPMRENDVEEIENPEFVDAETGEVQTMQAVVAHKVRPQSLMVLTLQSPRSSSSQASSPATPVAGSAPSSRHARSRSLPSAPCLPDVPLSEQVQSAQRRPSASPTASEERRRLETMYEHEEREDAERLPRTKKDNQRQKLAVPTATTESPQPKSNPGLPSGPPEEDERLKSIATGIAVPAAEIGTSPTNDTDKSTFLIEPDTEVIEDQGTAEKPSLTSVQRPKRKPSRDVTYRDEQSIVPAPLASEKVVRDVAESQSEKQNEDVPTLVHPVTDHTPSTEPSASLPPTPAREVRPSLDSIRGSRPASNSGDSARSSYSRSYHRPSPLNLTSGSQRSATSSVSSSMTERAAVQRIPTRASTSATSSSQPSNLTKPRRSGSFGSNREKRPMTAGSTTSQVSIKLKGLISRPNESGPPRPRRDSEASGVSGETGDSYDDTSGLDELIRSEETLHFTLTPKSVREMDFPDSPKSKPQRSNTADLADFIKTTGPEDAARPRISTRSATSSSQPSPKSRVPEKSKPSPIHVPRPVAAQKSKPGQARDARPANESSSDFAQFIRNSGPASPQLSAKRSSDVLEPSKKTRAGSAISSSIRGPKLQARSATNCKGEGNSTSDLIDFIREGPPSAGGRRIPRTVAPFHTPNPLDSDDFAYEQSTPSISSTQGESTATKSQVSVGSRTGLLDSSNGPSTKARAAPTKPHSSSSGKMTGDEDPRPKRTQRRIPDPYNLDWDDEEFEEMLEEPKSKREEESLIDFLRNVPPPESEPQVQPLSVNNAPRTKTPTGSFGGASSMKARLLRTTSSEKGPSSRAPSSKFSQASLRQQSGQQSSQYARRPSNYTTKSNSERNTDAMYGLPSVSERQTETSALADFLRNTGPPEPPQPPPSKDSSFSRRFFVRRKKIEA